MRPRPASRVPLALAALPCAAKPMSIDYPARGALTIRMDRCSPSPSGVAGKHPRTDGCGSPAISASATAGALVLIASASAGRTMALDASPGDDGLVLPQHDAAKALTHPLRAAVLERLYDRDASPIELAREMGEPLPNVSYAGTCVRAT